MTYQFSRYLNLEEEEKKCLYYRVIIIIIIFAFAIHLITWKLQLLFLTDCPQYFYVFHVSGEFHD